MNILKKFCSVTEYILMRNELDDIIVEFINEIYNLEIDKSTDSKYTKVETKIQPLLMDMFNHETFHRGMISLYLEILGIKNRIFKNIRSRK
jgi:uncharacterized damage-inducible protein DinB